MHPWPQCRDGVVERGSIAFGRGSLIGQDIPEEQIELVVGDHDSTSDNAARSRRRASRSRERVVSTDARMSCAVSATEYPA
jgi:hypothetical protein